MNNIKALVLFTVILLFVNGFGVKPRPANELDKNSFRVKLQPVNELYKLKLGMILADVEQVLGFSPNKDNQDWKAVYKATGIVIYPTQNSKDGLLLKFDVPDRTLMFIHVSDKNLGLSLFEITIGSKSSDIIKVFGQPKNKSIVTNSVFWEYPQYNISFLIQYDKVVGLIVQDFSKTNI